MSDNPTFLNYVQKLPDLLEQLYNTPADVGQWHGFLEKLTDATGSRSARLLVMDKEAKRVHYSDKVNIDDDQHRDYVNHFVNLCPWRPELALKAPGRLYNTYHDFSCKQDRFYQTEFFNDWARHLDIEHGLCGTVYHDTRYTVQLLVQRTGGQGAFPKTLTAQINRLIPHVQQVLHLNRALTLQQQQNLSVLQAAERTFMPFLLMSGQGELIYACPRAERLADGCSGMTLNGQQLTLQCQRTQNQLLNRVRGLAAGMAAGVEPVLVFSSEKRAPLRLLVEPMEMPGVSPVFWAGEATVAVYIQDPEEHLDIDHELLARLFGLTPAESRVGAWIAKGGETAQFAELNDVSVHTVRTQLKSAMAKLRVRRQAELVGVVLCSAAVRCINRNQAPILGADAG
ncbi:helix-turn-helix transcriptional regulator [Marinobacter confluentis]|nr:helix-turn-helix transcriptional regulator [Marinobacter confluentis]